MALQRPRTPRYGPRNCNYSNEVVTIDSQVATCARRGTRHGEDRYTTQSCERSSSCNARCGVRSTRCGVRSTRARKLPEPGDPRMRIAAPRRSATHAIDARYAAAATAHTDVRGACGWLCDTLELQDMFENCNGSNEVVGFDTQVSIHSAAIEGPASGGTNAPRRKQPSRKVSAGCERCMVPTQTRSTNNGVRFFLVLCVASAMGDVAEAVTCACPVGQFVATACDESFNPGYDAVCETCPAGHSLSLIHI